MDLSEGNSAVTAGHSPQGGAETINQVGICSVINTWCPSSESLSWCQYVQCHDMVFVGDISIVNGTITHL